MSRCVFCSYKPRNVGTTPRDKLTRRDKVAFEFMGKTICGDCSDRVYEFFEGEEQSLSPLEDDWYE